MFEVIISTVSTGRVTRKSFATRELAERYADGRRSGWVAQGRPARNLRVEVLFREPPAVGAVLPADDPRACAA